MTIRIERSVGDARADSSPLARTSIRLLRALLRLWPLVALLVLWELVVVLGGYNAIILPRPSSVLGDFAADPLAYAGDLLVTSRVSALGLVVGMAVGVLVAVAAWWSGVLAGLLTPLAITMYAVPTLAFVPVLAQVFGYNEVTIVAIAAIISFFPTFVYASSGLRELPAGTPAVFSALGARRPRMLVSLALPAMVPNVLVALRVTASTCVIAAVIGEYLMGTDGLGHAFVYAYKQFDMQRAFGIALLVMMLSFGAFAAATQLERWGRRRWL